MNRKRKTVLVLTTSFPVYEGVAVGIHVLEKCRQLVKNGWNVELISPGHFKSKKSEIRDGIKISRFSYFFPIKYQKLAYGSGIPTNLKESSLAKIQLPVFMISFFINALIKSQKVDLIHCHWSFAGLVGVLISRLTRKKVVFMMHGAEAFVLGDHPLLKFILKNCDYLICNSSYSLNKTLEIYPVKNYCVIPPGVDLCRFFPQNKVPDLKSKLNVTENDTFILTICKFIERKGVEYLIEAFNVLVNEKGYENVQLRIGGRGPLRGKYINIVIKYRLENHIKFLDYIPDEDIPSYYTESDIFVLPSIVAENGDTEGLGVVLLEANACRTPVIGSKVGGILDVIKHGRNGYLVEPKNPVDLSEKLEWLINDKDKRICMGNEGMKVVAESFSWDSIGKQIELVYEKLL